jgi:hypothetical protein
MEPLFCLKFFQLELPAAYFVKDFGKIASVANKIRDEAI